MKQLLILLVWFGATPALADETVSLAQTYRGLRTAAETAPLFWQPWVHEPVAQVAQAGYADLIKRAEKMPNLSASDLWAIGECHAALGASERALASFRLSLKKQDNADAHLGLARVLLATDVREADRHVEKAAALQPDHAELASYQLLASKTLESQRDWAEAARRLVRYLEAVKPLRERDPANRALADEVAQRGLELDRLRRFVALVGEAAPGLKPRAVIQGEKLEPAGLQGRVVVLDFWAAWSPPSRRRMDVLQRLAARHGDKDLVVVGCTQLVRQAYRAEDDQTRHDPALTPAQEQAGLAAFAARHKINYPLLVAGPATYAEYGVLSLPHTVVLDREGKVRHIFLAFAEEKAKDLEAALEDLVKTR
jgi:thiol-disulfide isomerase/thioredoxin